MPTKVKFVQDVAEISEKIKLGPKVKSGIQELQDKNFDPTLFLDDALTHFNYPGTKSLEEDLEQRQAQVDFMISTRSTLKLRFDDLAKIGHNHQSMTLVAIDKSFRDLDDLLDKKSAKSIVQCMAGKMKNLVAPATAFTRITSKLTEVIAAKKKIANDDRGNNYAEAKENIEDFDAKLKSLKQAIDGINHRTLKNHFYKYLFSPIDEFGAGPECYRARAAVAAIADDEAVFGRLNFRKKWESAKKIAGKRYAKFLKENPEKKAELSLHKDFSQQVLFDQDFGKKLQAMESKKKKSQDFSAEKSQVIDVAATYRTRLAALPEYAKHNAVPDFYSSLDNTLLGLLASIQKLT